MVWELVVVIVVENWIYVSNETNTDVLYVHFVEVILVDVVTLLYKDEVIWN